MSQRLNSLIASDHTLRQLADRAQQLSILQQHYEQIVSPALQRASRVMQLQQKTLVIAAFNSAVAAKLRQMTPDLLKHLQQCGHEVTVIQIRVQVSFPQPAAPARPPALSATGKQHLSELVRALPDSGLKQALENLIRRSKGQ